ncbi:MAG: helix-turn-helix domain-containing protein [Mesorhizobium sp.]|nr:MAG: helix-turn-helix domain-containing protein [Mesorhizobium sp.]
MQVHCNTNEGTPLKVPVEQFLPLGRLLDAREAALTLRVSVKTLANWRCSGKGPRYAKLGARVVYNDHDLNDFVRHSTFRSTSEY